MPGETSNGVSGVVHGPSVQARQISGGGALTAAQVSSLLPPPPDSLTGRC